MIRQLTIVLLIRWIILEVKMEFTPRKCALIALILLTTCSVSHADGVYTKPNATMWVGKNGSLSCQVDGIPLNNVGWTKDTTGLVQWSNTIGMGLGDESYAGKYSMDESYNLVIYNVLRNDTGKYRCVTSFEEGTVKTNITYLAVHASPWEPYPNIDACDTDPANCYIELPNGTDAVNVTCKATHFYPRVNLIWTVGGEDVTSVAETWSDNDDGTIGAQVTVNARAHTEPYVCTVSGEAVTEGTRSGSVRVNRYGDIMPSTPMTTVAEPTDDSSDIGLYIGIAAGVVGCIVLVIVVICCVRSRRSKKGKGRHDDVKYTKAETGKKVEDDDIRA